MRALLISSLLLSLSGCDACSEAPIEGEGEASEGEGDANEGEGDANEGEGDANEGEGEADEGEGDVGGEGEGDANEGEGDVGGEGEGEGEGDAAEGEGDAAEGEGEGEGDVVVDPNHGTGDVFVEIDYSFADDPERPDFRFSNTPGFGPAQWAYNDPFGGGMTTPDAWDRFQTMEVINDFRLGRVLAVTNDLQLMLGLPSFVTYDRVLVEIDGDEEAHSGVARYDVYNPLFNCGVFSQFDDSAQTDGIGRHTKVFDLEDCLAPGETVQAIRLDPVSGTVALKRMKVTLVNATW